MYVFIHFIQKSCSNIVMWTQLGNCQINVINYMKSTPQVPTAHADALMCLMLLKSSKLKKKKKITNIQIKAANIDTYR